MSKVRVRGFAVSIDGFGAGPDHQSTGLFRDTRENRSASQISRLSFGSIQRTSSLVKGIRLILPKAYMSQARLTRSKEIRAPLAAGGAIWNEVRSDKIDHRGSNKRRPT
jgi:hypothetical protein